MLVMCVVKVFFSVTVTWCAFARFEGHVMSQLQISGSNSFELTIRNHKIQHLGRRPGLVWPSHGVLSQKL